MVKHPFGQHLLVSFVGMFCHVLVAANAFAAPILWGTATAITGDSDVSTNGTLVAAFNVGGAGIGSTTINGVTFAEFAIPALGNSATVGNFSVTAVTNTLNFNNAVGDASPPFSGLSAAYQKLLSSIGGNATISPPQPFLLTISGLTAGRVYEFQWWASISHLEDNFRESATAGNTVILDANPSELLGGLGEFAIGTFIADSSIQVIRFDSDFQSFMNGFQLRELGESPLPIPEPDALMVWLAVLTGGLVLARWRTWLLR